MSMSGSCLDLLRRADAQFGRTLAEQPQNLQCRRGCTLCCYGLTAALRGEKQKPAWDLQWEDVVGREDQYTVAEAIMLVSRLVARS